MQSGAVARLIIPKRLSSAEQQAGVRLWLATGRSGKQTADQRKAEQHWRTRRRKAAAAAAAASSSIESLRQRHPVGSSASTCSVVFSDAAWTAGIMIVRVNHARERPCHSLDSRDGQAHGVIG